MTLTDTTLVNNNRGWTEYNDDKVCHVEDITEYEMVFLHNCMYLKFVHYSCVSLT